MNRREFLATSAATILPLRPRTGFRRSAGRLGPLACMPQREAGAVRRTGAGAPALQFFTYRKNAGNRAAISCAPFGRPASGAKGKFARSECWAFPDFLPVLRR